MILIMPNILKNLKKVYLNNNASDIVNVGWGKKQKQEINKIDEMAAAVLSCLVVILIPEGPHFAASLEVMLKECQHWAHVINISPVYNKSPADNDPRNLFTHHSTETFVFLFDSSCQSLAQNKAHCPNRELIPHLKHETWDSENRHVETRGESGKNTQCLHERGISQDWGKTWHTSVLAVIIFTFMQAFNFLDETTDPPPSSLDPGHQFTLLVPLDEAALHLKPFWSTSAAL